MRAGMWRRVLRPIETSMKAEGFLPTDSARRPRRSRSAILGGRWGASESHGHISRCFVWTAGVLPPWEVKEDIRPLATQPGPHRGSREAPYREVDASPSP